MNYPNDDSEHEASTVQLGFSVPITNYEQYKAIGHRSKHYDEWDGGQLGGLPNWLNPEYPPKHATTAVQCRTCQTTMNYLCQIYAPIDNLPSSPTNRQHDCDRAFHRTLYVFICPKANNADTNHTPETSVRVLRTQLPEENEYWPNLLDNDGDDDNDASTKDKEYTFCVVCGYPASKRCPLQKQYFCSKEHQISYKKYVFNKSDDSNNTKDVAATTNNDRNRYKEEIQNSNLLPNLFPMSEIVVEEEPQQHEQSNSNLHDSNIKTMFPTTTITEHDHEEYDSDEDIEQDDLNDIVRGGTNNTSTKEKLDPIYEQFTERITYQKDVQNQVIRYIRWPSSTVDNSTTDTVLGNGPLWIQSLHQPTGIPNCQYCNSCRKYEFQLMPQMIHYLVKKKQQKQLKNGENDEQQQQSTSKPLISNEMKDAIQQTDTILQTTPPELIPPELIDMQQKAISNVRNQVLNSTDDTADVSSSTILNWGVIVIYTCTNSCIPPLLQSEEKKQSYDSGESTDENLGAYVEEYAWVQPSID